MFQKLLHWSLFKAIAIAVLIAFVSLIPVESGYAQTLLPKPGAMVPLTGAFTPTLMRGLRVDLKDPFNLYFVMSNGEKPFARGEQKEEYKKLIKYFMASLITPNRDMWVNLSPKEADRIIPDNFSLTEMGRDLLAQDYLLKQFTASLISPDTRLGKDFWDQIYQKARALYGTTDIPVNTFNKVWIVADKADIYQKDDTAILVGSHLKVMLEQDLMAADANKARFAVAADEESKVARELAADIARKVIVPVIEKEVNEGANFAGVRQAYNSMILATWFKKTLKESLLGQVYADQGKVAGIAINDPGAKERIYQQYLQAYKTGVFNYIKEELDPLTQELLPRKYFSGGMAPFDASMINMVAFDQARNVINGLNVNVTAVTLTTAEGKQFTLKAPSPINVVASVAKSSWEKKLARVEVAEENARQDYEKAFEDQQDRAQGTGRLKRRMNMLFLALSLNSSFMSAMPASLRAEPVAKPAVTQTTQVQAPVAPALKIVGDETDRFKGTTAPAVLSAGFEKVTKGHRLEGHRIKVGDGFMTIEVGMWVKMGDVADLKDGVPQGVYPTKEGKVVVAIFSNNKVVQADVGGTQAVVPQKSTPYQFALLKELLKNKKMIDSLVQVGRGFNEMKARAYADSLKQRTAQDAGVALGKKVFDPNFGVKEREKTMNATTLEAQSPVNVMVQSNYYQRMGTFNSTSLGRGWNANIGPVIPFSQQLEMKGIIAAGNLSVMSILYIGDNVLQEINRMTLHPTNEQSWLIQGHKSFLGKMLGALTIDRPLVYGANNKDYELQANRITRIGLPRTIGQFFGFAAYLPVVGKIFGPQGELLLSGGYHYKYGAREISFYKSAYLNNDESKIFMVVERQLPTDRDELMKLANNKTFNMFNPDDVDRYLKFAQEGGGYARGLIIDKVTGEIQYSFISPRHPKGYTPDGVVLVSSNEKYKQMMVKETMVQNGVDEQGRKIIAFTRNRLTGEIRKMYTAENFPTPNEEEKEDRNKDVLEYTRWAAEVNYWLYHEKNGPEPVEVSYTDEDGHTKSVMVTPPPDDKMPIGMILHGLTGRIYFAGEENNFRAAAGKVMSQSVIYGKNYTDPVKEAFGALVNKEGEVTLVDKMPLLVEKTMPAISGVGAPAPKKAVEESQPDTTVADVQVLDETAEAPVDTTLAAEPGKVPQDSLGTAVRSAIKPSAEVQKKEKKVRPDQPEFENTAKGHIVLINRAGIELNNNAYGPFIARLKDEVDQNLTNVRILRSKVPNYMEKDAYARTDIRSVPSYIGWLMQHLDRHKEFEGISLDGQPAYKAWVTSDGKRFIPGKIFNDTANKGMQSVGVIYYMDGRMPAVATSSKDFVSLGWALRLGTANNIRAGNKNMVIVSLPDGEVEMSPKAMVKVEKGRVVGVFTAGIKTLKERNVQLRTLRQGGIEAENLATGEFVIYARSNVLTTAQKAVGILPERDFVALLAANKVDMVHVDGEAKGVNRFRILKQPRPRMVKGIASAEKALTLQEFYAKNFLVVWKGPKGREMTQFVPRSALERNAGLLATEAKDIIQLDIDGNEAARALRTRAGYQVIPMREMQAFLDNNFLAVAPGYKTAMFVPFTAIIQPGPREEIRRSSVEFQMIDVKGNKIANIYLSRNPLASRLEKFGPNGTTLIYALFDYHKIKEPGKADDGIYQLSRDKKPIGQTAVLSKEAIALLDPDAVKGQKAIIKSDYQTGVSTIEIFTTFKDTRPARVIDPLSQSVTYNDGKGRSVHRTRMQQHHWDEVRSFVEKFSKGKPFASAYSAAIDPKYRGIDISLGGRLVKDVLVFNKITEEDGKVVVDYIDVTGRRPGAYAMAGRMIFDAEGNKQVHYTGNILLPQEISDGNDLLAQVDKVVFSKKDVYYYESGPVGGFDRREVFERRDNDWIPVRTIHQTREAEIARNGIDYDRFIAEPEVNKILLAAGIDGKSVLRYTSIVTSEGVEIIDYIKQFDPLEKKVFTVYKYNDRIFKIVVATAHDPLTGEVVGSFTLNHNYERNERQEYLGDRELSRLKMSGLAKDIFNPTVSASYKEVTGKDLWQGLEREGITRDTKLVVVRSQDRLTASDGKFSDQWSLAEYKVMRLNDNTGRALATISGNGTIAITPWWDHTSLETLTAQRPFKDSVIPSPNIIPGSVRIHYTGKMHEWIVFDKFENKVTPGARYQAKVAEFLDNITYDVLTGRKVREEFKQDLSLIAQLVNKTSQRIFGREAFPTRKILNYDLKSNSNIPVNAVDARGQEVARWKAVSYDKLGNQTQIIKEQHPLLKFWWPTMARHYDGYGEGWQFNAKVTQFRSLLMAILAIIAVPVTVVLRAFQSSAKRKKAAAKVRAMSTGQLYDEDIMIAAQQRFAAKVVPSIQDGPDGYRFAMTGDPESLFLFNLNAIYTMGISRYIKAHGIKPEDYKSVVDTDALDAWDEYTASTGKYLAQELARSATTIVWDKVVLDLIGPVMNIAMGSAKEAKGSGGDVDAPGKLEEKLTDALKNNNDLKGKDLEKILANDAVLNIVKEMADVFRIHIEREKEAVKKYDIADTPIDRETHFALKEIRAKFLQKRLAPLKKALQAEIATTLATAGWDDEKMVGLQKQNGLKGAGPYAQIGKADQQIGDKLEVYFATYRDLLIEALDADLKAGNTANGEFEKVSAELGITVPGHSGFDYDHFQAFLKKTNFEPAPNRIIINNKGEKVYVADAGVLLGELKQGNLSRKDIDGYVKSLNRLTLKTFFGLGIKAIHPLLLDGTLMPRFILGGIGLSMLTMGTVSLGSWFATPIMGVAAGIILGGIGIVLGVGAVVDYFKISHSDHMPMPLRLGLAVAALAGAVVVFWGLPTVGVGLGLFLKGTMGVSLLTEAFSLAVWQRSAFGLSLNYHYRASSSPGRLRANILVWTQYFSFMAISFLFGWVTYGFFASQILLGAWPVLVGALVMFCLTAYGTNLALWFGPGFIASRFFPKEGADQPSDIAREWAGLKKDERLLINYVGPVLGSIGVMKEHIDKPEKIPVAVENVIKELQWLVADDSPAALGTLEGIRKTLGVPADRPMAQFVNVDVRKWLTLLYSRESEAHVSLMTDDQLLARGAARAEGEIPLNLSIVYDTPQEREQLIFAKEINQLVSLFNPISEKGSLNPYDAGVSLVGLAYMLRDTLDPEGVPLGKKTILAFTYNNTSEKNQDTIENFLRLFAHISGAEVSMNFVPTVTFSKSGTMNGDRSLSRDYEAGRERAKKLSQVRRILILDRNSNALDLRRHINDLVASMNNPEQVIMVAHRNTTNTRRYIGVQNYLVEFGQGNAMLGMLEKIATGWENNMGVYGWDALKKMSNPDFPRKGFTPETRKANRARAKAAGLGSEYPDQFGMIGFAMNSMGISEDYEAVLQEAHMLVALGYDPSYALSKAIHHKRRESFSNFELGSAVPRWAGGRNQVISRFLMQTINDIGPEAYVEREANRNVGRHYVGMPWGFLNLIMLPVSVVFGFNPFQGLWLTLATVGTLFNQILRLHGWGAMIDDSGFLFGTARFLFYQCRDAPVFAVRVTLEMLSLINSYGGLTFVFNVSGGGGIAHDTNAWAQLKANPLSFVSFKSVVGLGALTTGLMLVSTICGLTMAHVSMMFLAMFWGVNMLIGLFVSENQPGVKVWNGKGDNIAASLGGLSAVAFSAAIYLHLTPFIILGLLGIAGMVILNKLVTGNPQMKRLVSQFNRYFVRTSAATLLFALVPAGLFVKFNIWPNVTAIFTIKEFFVGVTSVLGGILGFIAVGYGIGDRAGRRVKKEYEATVARFWEKRDSLKDSKRIIVGQRIHQVDIYRDQMAYKRAAGALKEINDELDGNISVPVVLLMGSGPSAVRKPEVSVENKVAADAVLAVEKERVGWLRRKWEALKILEKHLKGKVTAAAMKNNVSSSGQNNADKSQVPDKVGGISLNDEHLTITIKVDGAGMPLPVQFQDPDMVNIQGLSPVIREISPVTATNMPVLAELMK